MKTLKKSITYCFLLTIFVSCGNENKEQVVEATTPDANDFEAFYNRFHSDSVYQIEHILFPLQGLPTNADTTILRNRDFYYQKEGWVVQNRLPENSDFRSEIAAIDSALVIERILHQSGQYAMERRFAKMDGEWMLIYYAGVNRVAQ
ncbi:MAG: hypothetical protein AAGG68_01500 [Bacteroidota bacterium]